MKKPRQLTTIEVLCPNVIGIDPQTEIIPGIRGVTFIPSISPEGVLTWTNDGGLPNPEPINIMGPGSSITINGKTGDIITLTAADVGAISINDFDVIDCGTSTEVI